MLLYVYLIEDLEWKLKIPGSLLFPIVSLGLNLGLIICPGIGLYLGLDLDLLRLLICGLLPLLHVPLDLELVDLELGGVGSDEAEVVHALVLGDVGADRGLPLPTHQVDPQGLLTYE